MAQSTEDRTLPILTHILGYLFSWIAPLVILLASEHETVKKHARRSLNWHLTYVLYLVVFVFIIIVSIPLFVIGIGFVTFMIALLALVALSICDLVFSIIAAVRASNDELYTYPCSIPFVSDPTLPKPAQPSKETTSENRSSERRTAKRTSKRTPKRTIRK